MTEISAKKNMLIELRDVWKTYQTGAISLTALKGVNLDILSGEMTAIMGPSGSGKSTLMNIIGCLDRPTGGTYTLLSHNAGILNRKELASIRNSHIGFVFQSFNLIPRTTALENVELPVHYRHGIPSVKARKLARESLERVGLGERIHHVPNQLSGGQQQRVALARALAGEPEVLLLDEPFSALDSLVKSRLEDELLKLQEYYQGHVLYVTHNLEEAYRLSSRMAVIEAGQVLQQGERQDVIQRPANRRVAVLTGVRNLFSGVICSLEDHRVQLEVEELGSLWVDRKVDQGFKLGQRVTAGIRPGHIRLGKREACNSAVVAVSDCVEEVSGCTYHLQASNGRSRLNLETSSANAEQILRAGGGGSAPGVGSRPPVQPRPAPFGGHVPGHGEAPAN